MLSATRRLFFAKAVREVKIDIYSDAVCPWCFVGKRGLDKVAKEMNIILKPTWHPYILDVDVKDDGILVLDYLREKYFAPESVIKSDNNPYVVAGKELGIKFNWDRKVVPTINSHILMSMAGDKSHEVAEDLFIRYFERAENVASPDVLLDVAKSHNIDIPKSIFSDPRKKAQIIAESDRIHEFIKGVPHYVFSTDNLTKEVHGGQTIDNFKSVIVGMSRALIKQFFKTHKAFPICGRINTVDYFPDVWPFPNSGFGRIDENDDSLFYNYARWEHHVSTENVEFVRNSLRGISNAEFNSLIDIGASFDSYLPLDLDLQASIGVGLNMEELDKNPLFKKRLVCNLNEDPSLSFCENESVDLTMMTFAVDYFTKPRELFTNVNRISRKGGVFVTTISDRFFEGKVVDMWLDLNMNQRTAIVAAYFHHAGFRVLDILNNIDSSGEKVVILKGLKLYFYI